ncbi:MAG TPA: TonB-dependent receptor [Steroidobacteraceae bacterium]
MSFDETALHLNIRPPQPRCHAPLYALAALALTILPPIAAADELQLQEVIVTATRRAESESRVPISMTALTQAAMDDRGIKNFTDVARFTPGVTIDGGVGSTNSITIRGIGSSGGAGTTGIYIDDTPIQIRGIGFGPDDTLPETFDLARVEVLRGPQGTLFGAGSEGGTVRYIITQPSLTTTSTYVRSELSTTEGGAPSYEAGVAHGGPIVNGVFGYRADIWYRHDGGWIDRVDPFTGQTVDSNANHGGTFMGRLAAIWQPVSGLTITPSVIYQDRKFNDTDGYWPILSNPDNGRFVSGNPDRRPVPDKYYLPAVKIEWDLGKVQLISNTSYYHRDEQGGYQGTIYNLGYFQTFNWPGGLSSTALPFLDQSLYPLIDNNGVHLPQTLWGYRSPATITNDQTNWTQEIRLQSTDPQSRLSWTVGAFWSLDREKSIEEINDPMIDTFFMTAFGVTGTGPDGFGYPLLPNGDDYYNLNIGYDRQLAGFGQATLKLIDGLSATAGVRVSKTSFTSSHYADGSQNFGPGYGSGAASETPITPKFGLQWQINDANMVYATYAKGFRIGGANPPLPPACGADLATLGISGEPETFKSDSTQSYEVGAKDNIANRVRLDSSVYYIRWNGIQQNVYLPGCGLQFTGNFGQAVSKGFDFQGDFLLGGGISLQATVGHNSARFTATSPESIVVDGDAISGFSGAPSPWTASVGAQYAFAVGEHASFIRLDYEYRQRNHLFTAQEDPNSSQYNPNTFTTPTTHFASLRLGTNVSDWDIQFFIDNLFDTHVTTGYSQSDADYANPNGSPPPLLYDVMTYRPRTYGIDVLYHGH